MRETKFKIWYPDSKIMKGPYSIDLFYIKNSVHPEFSSSERHIYLQYTGLKDKNSVKIFEGDIVSVVYSFVEVDVGNEKLFLGGEHNNFLSDLHNNVEIKMGKIYWADSYAGFVIDYGNDAEFNFKNPKSLETIGNIYQHPELLEKK